MSLTKFVINLDSRPDRWEYWANRQGYVRWSATPIEAISDESNLIDKMISYHNIRDTPQHKGKIACLLSHTNLWRHIITCKLNNVLILEDDAMGYVREEHLNDLMDDGITYFGGFFTRPKITEKLNRTEIDKNIVCGINLVDPDKFRVMTNLAYYIPTWEIAMEMFVKVMEKDRYRAIDIMLANECSINKYFVYPAWFEENPSGGSNIREGKVKFARSDYSFK
jgi:hypothetical protein